MIYPKGRVDEDTFVHHLHARLSAYPWGPAREAHSVRCVTQRL